MNVRELTADEIAELKFVTYRRTEMAKRQKPHAYLKKVQCGYWGLEYSYAWRAEDAWGNYVAQARIKKECERETREAGYVPIDE